MKKLALVLLSLVALVPPCNAANDSRSSGAEGAQSHSNYGGKFGSPVFFDQGAPIYHSPQIHMDSPWNDYGATHDQLAPEGWSHVTNSQGAGAPNGPLLRGKNSYDRSPGTGNSGTVTSAPYPGSYSAPGNLAVRQVKAFGNQLPPTRLDSFVYQSGYNDAIYGDEGTNGPPPYMHFDYMSRINYGIRDERDEKLTTGHGSYLPSAWGYDEITMGGRREEASWSAPTGLSSSTAPAQPQMVPPRRTIPRRSPSKVYYPADWQTNPYWQWGPI